VPDPDLIDARAIWASDRFALVEETFATPDGPATRPVIHHPGAVAILAQPLAGQVLLVRQFRYAVRRWTLEVPAGTRVAGEAPETTARRELAEEAGFAADSWRELARFLPAPGVSDEEMILYRADGLRPAAARPDHGELVGPQILAVADLPRLIAEGAISDAKTLIALAILGVPLARKAG
jgi:ADP-ribose pyrophosphatase